MPASDDADRARLGPVAVAVLAVAQAALFVVAFPMAWPGGDTPVAGAWPLIVFAPLPLAVIAVGARSKWSLAIVFGVQVGMWLWIQGWIREVTAVGYPLLAAYLASYAVAFTWLLRRLDRHPRTRAVPLALTVPVVWVGLEFLRGEVIFDGYAWYLIAHPLVEGIYPVQSADLLGQYLPGALAAAISGVGLDVGRGWRTGRRRVLVTAAIVVAVHLGNLAYGIARVPGAPVSPADAGGPRVLVVQTNVPQSNKIRWDLEQKERDVASFVALTREAMARTGPVDLVVWPETMLPVHGLEPEILRVLEKWQQTTERGFAADAFDLSEALATPLLVGSTCFVGLAGEETEDGARWAWESFYNSAYLLEGRRRLQRYDKHQLTPFGEVMPYISAWPWLERSLLALGAQGMSFEMDASPRPTRLAWTVGERTLEIGTPICFEDTVARVCRRLVHDDGRKQAHLLVNLSNDGWFGASVAGRAQHAQIARLRCIENRVPMLRCANTGLSLAIDSAGRLVGSIGDGRYGTGRRAGTLVAAVSLDDRRPWYGRVGEAFGWVLLSILGLGTALTFARRAEGTSP